MNTDEKNPLQNTSKIKPVIYYLNNNNNTLRTSEVYPRNARVIQYSKVN